MFRIAPTPSGYLHLGNAFSFLLTRCLADRAGAGLMLRIDDLDSERKRPEYVQDVFDSLDWLGIHWEKGPKDPDDFERNWSQHHRLPDYMEAIERMRTDGKIFACRCTRNQLKAYGSVYPDLCASTEIPFGEPDTVLRIRVPSGTAISFDDHAMGRRTVDLTAAMGSFTVLRRDGIPAYQLASVVDDRLFGVTTIVRGTDLLASTAAQCFLADAIGFGSFHHSRFFHHRLLTDEKGEKLSKSEGAFSLKSMRESGITREDVLRRLQPFLDEYLERNL
jgi:glutamyl-tRNA synthetase